MSPNRTGDIMTVGVSAGLFLILSVNDRCVDHIFPLLATFSVDGLVEDDQIGGWWMRLCPRTMSMPLA